MDLSQREQMRGVRETRRVPFQGVELRATDDGSGVTFEGYACVTETPYEMVDWAGPYTEIVRHGAFAKTLSEGADVAFLLNHEGMTLARTKSGTLKLSEDETGLHVGAELDPANAVVGSIRSAMGRGDLDEMSFAFRTTRQQWSPDYDQRDILEVSMDKGDVSVVNYGANPNTFAAMRGVSLRQFSDALCEVRAGATLSAATQATLKHCLSLFSTADDAVDEGQEVLSTLLGVPNPDTEDEGAGDGSEQEQNSFPLSLALALEGRVPTRAGA